MVRKLLVGALLSLGLFGCGDGQKVKVYLTDAPLADATEVNILVTGIQAKGDGDPGDDDSPLEEGDRRGKGSSHGTLTFDEPRLINLLELRNGVRTLLGEVEYVGELQQLRLLMDGKATVVYLDGTSKDAFVPSGAQTGVKIVNVPDDAEEITLDFDAEKSIHETGNGGLIMRPTIRALRGEEVIGDSEKNPLEE